MWFEQLRINVYVDSGTWNPIIGSYKVQTCCHGLNKTCSCKGVEDEQVFLSNDNKTLFIKNVKGTCCSCNDKGHNVTLWIGLILANEGEIPARVNGVNISINGNYTESSVETYFYGPYKTGIGYQEWGRVDGCDLSFNNYTYSLLLDQGYKGIAWIKLEIYNVTGYLYITVTPDFTTWNTM